jgi:hypothetical protein
VRSVGGQPTVGSVVGWVVSVVLVSLVSLVGHWSNLVV